MDMVDPFKAGSAAESPAYPDADPLLVKKLRRLAPFGPGDRRALSRALSLDIRDVRVRSTLEEGAGRERKVAVLLKGWACCYRQFTNGQRHLVACYLPGDVCDLHTLAGPRSDTVIDLLAGARIARLSTQAMAALDKLHPVVTQALWLDAQVASSIEREWLVNVARRSARERVAHLLSEFAFRSEMVEESADGQFDLPITQAEFASACGLTASHANRVLRLLHEDGVVTWRNTHLLVRDRGALEEIAGFLPGYLNPVVPDFVKTQQSMRMLAG